MASSTANPNATNLATLLAVKRKMAGNKPDGSNGTQPVTVAGAHSKEKITYRPDIPAVQPNPNTTPQNNTPNQSKPTAADKAPTNKVSRKTKQLEVDLLEKKMEEIQRKQEEKTNEALESWKGFEDMNYGFYSNGAPAKAPAPTENRAPVKQAPLESPPKPIEKKPEEKPIVREPSPRKPPEESPRPAPKQEAAKPTSREQEEQPKPRVVARQPPRQPSPEVEEEEPPKPIVPPTPPPRRSRSNSQRTASREKSPEQEPVPTRYHATITPIPLMRSNPKPTNKEPATFLGSTWNPVSAHPFRIFPDIKPHRPTPNPNACKSIQRSMDRYRFYVW